MHAEIRSQLTALIDAAPLQRRSVLEATLEPHRELITQAHATIRRYVQRITNGTAGTNDQGKSKRSSRKVTARKTSAKS